MTSRITELKDFDDLKDVIFKKLQDEIKEVSLFHESGKFEAYEEQVKKYNKLYYTFYHGFMEYSDVSRKLDKYDYTAKNIKKLMVNIATGLQVRNDANFLNIILRRRELNLSFDGTLNLQELKDDTAKLQVKYNELSWIKRVWLKV